MCVSLTFKLLFLFLAFNNALTSKQRKGNPEVNTTSGLIVGRSLPESHAFYSIPYGEAPIKEQRFQPPLPVSHRGRINCSIPNYRRCYGSPIICNSENECQTYSEDCLVLNVHVPSTKDLSYPISHTELLPVMVWIHGGGFTFGAGTERLYDGQLLSNSTNTIVVSINYRLNALGFLAFEEGETRFDGNQGIKDQQLALKWVYDNIRKFGGDKSKVTLFGGSAGAQSIIFHLMSNISKPFFKRAMVQSNPGAYHYPSRSEALRITETLLTTLNCAGSRVECLMEVSPETLMQSHRAVVNVQSDNVDSEEPYRPLLDGVEFTVQPFEYFSKPGERIDKDIVLGTASDETAFIKLTFAGQKMTKQRFMAESIVYIGKKYGSKAAEKYLQFAGIVGNDYDYTNLLAQQVADYLVVCPTRALARLLSTKSIKTSPANVYLYVFDYMVDAKNCREVFEIFSDLLCNYASHSAELPYLFDSGLYTGLRLRPAGLKLSRMLRRFWGHFAHHGKPNRQMRAWSPYYEAVQNGSIPPWTNIRLRPPRSFLEADYRDEMCDFWDSSGLYVNLTSPTASYSQTTSTPSGCYRLKSNLLLMGFLFAFTMVMYQCFDTVQWDSTKENFSNR